MIWIILGIILLILIIVFFSPIKIYVSYFNDKPKVILKYLFIKRILVGDSLKNKSEKKKKKEVKKQESKENTEKQKQKKKNKLVPDTFSEKLEFIKNIAGTGGRAFRRITKHTKIKDILIDIQISDLDACDCAIKFGKTNMLVYNMLRNLGHFVTLKKKSINIYCVYNQPECIYKISFYVRITPATLIFTVLAFIFRFLVNNIKVKKEH